MTTSFAVRKEWAAFLLILAGMAGHLWWATRGWDIPGMSGHEFRQAQTALTVQAMQEDGFRLDYSTPVFGQPWSVPFEFPAYQFATAEMSRIAGMDIVTAGRCVSLIAFYLAVAGVVRLLRRFGFSPVAAALGALPVLCAPVYFLYSRAVMIESTALAASVWFLYWLVCYRQERRWWQFLAALVFGVGAVLVKSTTWAVFCVPWAVWGLSDVWRARAKGWKAWRAIAEDVFLLGVPLLAVGFGWVWITDRIKEMNPLAAFTMSSELKYFNFGTWAQRWDPGVWAALWRHWNAAVMPWWGLALAAAGVWAIAGRNRRLAALGLVAFLAAQAIFINLYAIHEYYFYAAGLFACGALGICAAALWDGARWGRAGRWVGVGVLAIVCAGQFLAYQRQFYRIQVADNSGDSGLIQAIRRLTKPDDLIVVHSGHWSSELPFRTHRRMMMIPDSQMFFRPDAVRKSVEMQRDLRVPLVIFFGESREHADWVLERSEDFGLELVPLFTWFDAAAYGARDSFLQMRDLLEKENFHGVSLSPADNVPLLKEPVPIASLPEAEEIGKAMSPRAETGSFPYGVSFYDVDGTRMLLAHSPTELIFPIPAGATRVEVGYRMDPQVFEKPTFDGVYVVMEVRKPGKRAAILHREWVTPRGDRSPRRVTVPLGSHTDGKLAFLVLPGPASNNTFDWALLEYLRIR